MTGTSAATQRNSMQWLGVVYHNIYNVAKLKNNQRDTGCQGNYAGVKWDNKRKLVCESMIKCSELYHNPACEQFTLKGDSR